VKERNDLELMLHSQVPIIGIETLEEPRLLQLLTRLSMRLQAPLYQWSVTNGIRRLEVDSPPQRTTAEPVEALKHIKAVTKPGFYLLLDFHPYLEDPIHVRLLKEIAQDYENTARTLILVSHSITIPPEIRHLTARFTLHLPDRGRIRNLIKEEAVKWQQSQQRKIEINRDAVDQLANNLMGLTTSDARRLIRHAIQDDGAITKDDIPKVAKAKFKLMGDEGLITFEYDTANFSDVAGLRHLKKWLEHRSSAFIGKTSSLDRPKGIMLLGVQGCGKSLAAKAVAGHFAIPLLRLDFGVLFNKYIGETEKNLRQTLQTAEMMAPCVLWIDEIEKGLSQEKSDNGTSQRILGTLLTWMAENKSGVFIVATSNNIESLPAELVRKGRLDEIFFVDLPDTDTRGAIFDIHLRGRNLAPSAFDLSELMERSEGFSGAEIEQAVVSALYTARARDAQLNQQGLVAELDSTRPLSTVMSNKIAALRSWADGRTVAAN